MGAEAILAAMIVEARPSLANALRASSATQAGDELTLAVSPDFQGFAREHEGDYRDLARKVTGRPMKVQIAATAAPASATASAAPFAPKEDDMKKQRLIADASREPAVQEALDLFNGKVVDVREG